MSFIGPTGVTGQVPHHLCHEFGPFSSVRCCFPRVRRSSLLNEWVGVVVFAQYCQPYADTNDARGGNNLIQLLCRLAPSHLATGSDTTYAS